MRKNLEYIFITSFLISIFLLNSNLIIVDASDTVTMPVENFSDLLNHIKTIDIKITDYEGDSSIFRYEVYKI